MQGPWSILSPLHLFSFPGTVTITCSRHCKASKSTTWLRKWSNNSYLCCNVTQWKITDNMFWTFMSNIHMLQAGPGSPHQLHMIKNTSYIMLKVCITLVDKDNCKKRQTWKVDPIVRKYNLYITALISLLWLDSYKFISYKFQSNCRIGQRLLQNKTK